MADRTTDGRLGIALREALDGPKGALDAFLEVHNEAEVKSAIQNMAWGERRQFAAMAMQGLCSSVSEYGPGRFIGVDELAADSVACADALLAALARTET